MSQDTGSLSRRGLLQLGAVAGSGLLIAGCDVGGKSSNSGTQGSGEGKITALFMKQAGYSEEYIRGMTADFVKAKHKINDEPTFVGSEALHDNIDAASHGVAVDM